MIENGEQFSKQFLNSIKTIQNIPCYVKLNQSKYLVIALHQHLGLVQNFTDIVNKFVQTYASILIPDLFCNIDDEQIDQNDQFSLVKRLKISQVDSIVRTCIQYGKNKQKKIILLGFSLGAALGLKLIQTLKNISAGVFFYGYPIVKNLQPQNISCPLLIFHAKNDKIKYLSDQDQYNQLFSAYKACPLIKIQKIVASHGFMNPQHPNYDQKSAKYCRKAFHQMLRQAQKSPLQKKGQQKQKNVKKEQQSGGCSIF